MNRDHVHITEILSSVAKIATYSSQQSSHPSMAADATKYQLIVIGEAVARLSDETKMLTAHIPWSQIRAQRNYLAHQYDEVDDARIARIYGEYLQPMADTLETLQEDLRKGND